MSQVEDLKVEVDMVKFINKVTSNKFWNEIPSEKRIDRMRVIL